MIILIELAALAAIACLLVLVIIAVPVVRARWEQWRRKRALWIIRDCMAFFGYPIWDMTDEEIEAAVMQSAHIVADFGISAQEAADGLTRLAHALAFAEV